MKIIEKYTGDHTYMFPNGELATPERMLADFPAILAFAHIIETDERREVCWAVENLSATRSMYGLDASLCEGDAIAAIQEIRNRPPVVDTTPTPEERTAAALEFQNMVILAEQMSANSGDA